MSKVLNLNTILKENKGPEGISLFDHLCNFLISEDLLNDKSRNLYDNFEKISNFLKNNYFDNSKKYQNKNILNSFLDQDNNILNLIKEIKNMKFNLNQNIHLPNVVELNKNLNFMGKGLIKDEIIILNKSILKFINNNSDLFDVKFFGKIFGIKKDYYILYAKSNKNFKENIPEDWENSGEGINEIKFYVTNSVLENWIELPLISPNHVITSKFIGNYFTGELESEFNTYPIFNGKEKHLLKAKLVRILYSCEIVPSSAFKIKEDNEKEIERDLEFEFPNKEDVMNLENWSHYNDLILKCGRNSYFISKNLEEEAKDELIAKYEEEDPIGEKLRGISNDVDFENYWSTKYFGDNQIINSEDGDKQMNYGIVTIFNSNWPGAYTIINVNNKIINFVYLGYGNKNNQVFLPKQNLVIYQEPEDLNEEHEPNHKEEVKNEEENEDNEEENENENENENDNDNDEDNENN